VFPDSPITTRISPYTTKPQALIVLKLFPEQQTFGTYRLRRLSTTSWSMPHWQEQCMQVLDQPSYQNKSTHFNSPNTSRPPSQTPNEINKSSAFITQTSNPYLPSQPTSLPPAKIEPVPGPRLPKSPQTHTHRTPRRARAVDHSPPSHLSAHRASTRLPSHHSL